MIFMPPESEPQAYYNTEAADYLRALLGEQVKIRYVLQKSSVLFY
jgi:hypothetical protein